MCLYVLSIPSPIPSPTSSFALSWQRAGDMEVSNDNDNGGVDIDACFADRSRDSLPLLYIFAMPSS
jgi:hypothetical protein